MLVICLSYRERLIVNIYKNHYDDIRILYRLLGASLIQYYTRAIIRYNKSLLKRHGIYTLAM